MMIANEGGYQLTNVSGDRGGQTYAGIARKMNPQWAGWAAIDRGDIPPTQLVREFYASGWWAPIRGDEIADQRVAESIFDFAVNTSAYSRPTVAVKLAQIVVLRPEGRSERLWSLEQILRSGSCGCLVGWLEQDSSAAMYASLRRLQIAARNAAGPVFLFRKPHAGSALSPAALRIHLEQAPAGLKLRILKQRGGRAGQEVLIRRPSQLLARRVLPELLPACVSGGTQEQQTDQNILPGIRPPAAPTLPHPSLH